MSKGKVRDFWENASCGEELYLKGFSKEDYTFHLEQRYKLEPQIFDFADFPKFNGKKTLEIGVGLGADHLLLAKNGAILTGIDLTERAVNHTKRRFKLNGQKSKLFVSDAENLPFDDQSFDCIYSWGVIHHSPNTQKCIDEIFRVLKKGGFAKIMVYSKHSLVGYMLWFRYAFLKMNLFRTLYYIYHNYLESHGTKAFSMKQIKKMLKDFKIISIETTLGHGDLLESKAGQRHEGVLLKIARIIWSRWFFRRFMKNFGLGMMISIRKE